MFKNAIAGRSARRGLIVALALIGATGVSIPVSAHGHGEFNHEGNILVADQFNNRVIEIDRDHNVVWQFGVGPNDVTAKSAIGVNDAQRVGNLTLIAGTGAPPEASRCARPGVPTTGSCS